MADYIDAEAAKTGFRVSGQDLFGRYARIAYGHAQYGRVPGKQEYHIYKVIQSFRSNAYCDVPLTYQTEHNCYNHGEIVDVVNVVHCGIDESSVIRVALKDVEILPAADVVERKRGEWIYEPLDKYRKYSVTCPFCGSEYTDNYDGYVDVGSFNFCPNCGAEMGEVEE